MERTKEEKEYFENFNSFIEIISAVPVIEDISIEAREAYLIHFKRKPWFKYFYCISVRDISIDGYFKYLKNETVNA